MNFQNVNLPVLAKFISEITGKNFVLNENVRGKVNHFLGGSKNRTRAAGSVQRVLEQHVHRGDLVDDRKIDILAPELGDDRLVILFLAHWNPPLDVS
jgi:hypothetical protein